MRGAGRADEAGEPAAGGEPDRGAAAVPPDCTGSVPAGRCTAAGRATRGPSSGAFRLPPSSQSNLASAMKSNRKVMDGHCHASDKTSVGHSHSFRPLTPSGRKLSLPVSSSIWFCHSANTYKCFGLLMYEIQVNMPYHPSQMTRWAFPRGRTTLEGPFVRFPFSCPVARWPTSCI